MLSVPSRVCYFLQTDAAVQTLALHIFVSAMEQGLHRCSPDIGPETIAEIQTQVRHRLLRYCARPAFALERLREIDAERFGL